MRIDRLLVRNFKGFEEREFEFTPSFNLLIGDNGTGKTSVLDALAVAAGGWFVGLRGSESRYIRVGEVRLAVIHYEEDIRFEEQYPVEVRVEGEVLGQAISWARTLNTRRGRTTTGEAALIKRLSRQADEEVRQGKHVALPLVSYYGTGRLWLEPRECSKVTSNEKLGNQRNLSRLEGYRNSVDPRLSVRDLVRWLAQQSWAGYQHGRDTPVFRAVKQAILDCVEGAENLYFDPKRGEVIVAISGQEPQPFANLSDGQRCMLALVGDIAQKSAKLNPQFGETVLAETPGVVLIDELDLHLHPKWQRRVIEDLRKTFPSIQFVATTHSPQIVGELPPEEVLMLEDGKQPYRPGQSLGMDSNWVLRHLMEADDRSTGAAEAVRSVEALINKGTFRKARMTIAGEKRKGFDLPEWSVLEARMARMELLGR